jgi:hypothetical protein
MKKLLLAGTLLLSTFVGAQTTVVIVRHGEKPEAGLGQITCQGLNRALALPSVLRRYGPPSAIYATNPAVKKKDRGGEFFYIRPLATIEPYAVSLGMPVDITYEMLQTGDLADKVLRTQGLVVVAWEHHLGAVLARDIVKKAGGDPSVVPGWNDADFDSIYVVRVNGNQVEFKQEQQGLKNLSEHCPGP